MTTTFSVAGNSAGPFTSTVDKFCVHTTEGSSIEGAIAAYRSGNSWPHDTVDFRVGKPYRICRHLNYDVAARALRNIAGGVQTNTDSVIQVEVVGFAENPGGIDWEAFGREYAGPVCRELNIQVVSTVPWVAYPASYGINAAQRLSASAWTNYRGILGHQHVPENSHGDPGAIPIGVVLKAAESTPPPTGPPLWRLRTMQLISHPGDKRVDSVEVGPDRKLWHKYAPTAEAFYAQGEGYGVEDLEGSGYQISACWEHDGDELAFVVMAHGENDHAWMRVWHPVTGWNAWRDTGAWLLGA